MGSLRCFYGNPQMNLSRQTGTPATRGVNVARPLPGAAHRPRVFRYRHKVDGCPMWYAKDLDSGRVLGVEIIRPGMDECAAIARLVLLAYGTDFGKRGPKLVKDDGGASEPRPFSAALLARVCRAHASRAPERPPHR